MPEELITPEKWIGVRSRRSGRFYAEISHGMEHEHLGIYPTPHMAALVVDARSIDVFKRERPLNFGHLSDERIKQLAKQAQENEVRPNERMKLGIEKQQTLGDIVEIFKEDDNNNPMPIVDRRLVDIVIPEEILQQENFSGPNNEYRYFLWEDEFDWLLDKYEMDDENVWLRRWAEPRKFAAYEHGLFAMEELMEIDNNVSLGDDENRLSR